MVAGLDRFGYPEWLDSEATRISKFARLADRGDIQAAAQQSLRRVYFAGVQNAADKLSDDHVRSFTEFETYLHKLRKTAQ